MKLAVELTLNLEVDVDNEMVDRLSVDGYDIAMLLAGMYGDDLITKTEEDDDNRITVKSWKVM